MDRADVPDDAHATSVGEMKMNEEPEPVIIKASSQAGAQKDETSGSRLDKDDATKPAASLHAASSLPEQVRLKSPPPSEQQQPVAAKQATAQAGPASVAAASPSKKKRKGRPKQASEGMDEAEQKEFYRKRNAMYSRRKYMRKKIEIEVLQSQQEDKMNENRRLKSEGDHLSRLLQDAKEIVALHETHGLHGFNLPPSVLGVASSSSSSINLHRAPISTAQEQPSALAGLASAAQLQLQLQRQLSSSSFAPTMMQTRPPVSTATGLSSSLQLQRQQQQRQQQQQLSLQQASRGPNSLRASNTLEQELYDLLVTQVQSREASHPAVASASASTPQGLRSAQDHYQNVLHGFNLGQGVQQGRQLPLESLLHQRQQPSVASVLHHQIQGGGMGSTSFATGPSQSLSTEDILTLLQHGVISADEAAALLELTTASSEPSIPPSSAIGAASSSTTQEPQLSAIDSASLLFLLQQQQQSQQQQQDPAPSSSPASSTWRDFLRRQSPGE